MTQVSYKRKQIPWGAYKDVTPKPVGINPQFKKGETLGTPYKNRAEADAAAKRNAAWEKTQMSGVGYIANQRRGLHQ